MDVSINPIVKDCIESYFWLDSNVKNRRKNDPNTPEKKVGHLKLIV
jgi:hypothetical protein